MQPGFEIDFLPVGTGERAGDAIVVRYGDLFGPRERQRIVVVDAGFADTGTSVVDFVRTHFRTNHVDLVVSTHPDADHSAGLIAVFESLTVGQLWMHLPWEHTDDIARMFRDGRVTDASVSDRLRRDLDGVRAIEQLARRKGIPIVEPFEGVSDGVGLAVLGPTQAYYECLLPHFRATPEPRHGLAAMLEKAAAAARRVFETFDIETLTDDGETSAENDSSAILLLSFANKNSLLTGDAGVPAITRALDFLDRAAPDRQPFSFVQVPHHGSRRNVGPTVLNRLLGPPQSTETATKTAFVSSPLTHTSKHPSKRVTNAFRRRGAPVHATEGNAIQHRHNSPRRPGYGPIFPIPFHHSIDE